MAQIFLSDVHLGVYNAKMTQKIENEIIRLVDYCESEQIQIHILGDFFDYWMEFPNYTPSLGKSILHRLKQYNQSMGNNTLFITGNHDYWTISYFEELGFHVVHEYATLKLGDKNLFLCHGDGLKGKKFNLPRPLFHKFIRNPKFVTFYKLLFSEKMALYLMKSFSSFTRDKEDINTERLSVWAEYMFQKFSYDVIITGHDHVPRMETFLEGTYINTGSYHDYKTVVKHTKGVFELVTWNDGLEKFQPFEQHSN